ncbi:MAG: phytanoyl-CoA dioxygenase family protein [Sphingosinicella sp.]
MSARIEGAAVEAYRARGWAVFAGLVAAAELKALQRETERLMAQPALFSPEGRGRLRAGAGKADRIDLVSDLSPPFAALRRSPVLAGLARTLLGGEPVAFKDRLVTKPAGMAGYGPHQDAAYWQGLGVADEDFVTLALCLDRCTRENGTIEVAEGQHRRLLSPPGEIADVPADAFADYRPILCAAGDVIALHPLVPHRSGPNRSSGPRRMVSVMYALGAPELAQRYRAAVHPQT